VRDLARMLEVSLPPGVRLELAFPDELPLVAADAGQMRQVVLNLVTNAAEALGGKPGTVRVAAGVRGEGPDRRVRLEIADDGCGMTPEVQARMFEPFFSTKFTGRGLGLAAVHGIVAAHGGTLEVESAPGAGTRVRVLLPVTTEKPRGATPPVGLARVAPGACVLLVDDDETVRRVGRRLVESLGLKVLDAPDGRSALAVLQQDPERVTVAVVDLTMPGWDGLETLVELRKVRPDLPVHIASGYAREEFAGRPEAAGVTSFLAKPYTRESLERLLAAPAPEPAAAPAAG
jgi:CheY-like chemotaxis protein